MTVAELIEKLREMPQDALVVSEGFDETGLVELSEVHEVIIVPVNCGFICEFDYADTSRKTTGAAIPAVYIGLGSDTP